MIRVYSRAVIFLSESENLVIFESMNSRWIQRFFWLTCIHTYMHKILFVVMISFLWNIFAVLGVRTHFNGTEIIDIQ